MTKLSLLNVDLKAYLSKSNNIHHSHKCDFDFLYDKKDFLKIDWKYRLPGWYMLEINLYHDQPFTQCTLSYNCPDGNLKKFCLPIKNGRISKRIVYVPLGVNELNFTPLNASGNYSLRSFNLKWLTPWFAKSRLVSRLINMHFSFRDLSYSKAIRLLKEKSSSKEFYSRAFNLYDETFINRSQTVSYLEWVDNTDDYLCLDSVSEDRPLISILLPVYKTDINFLKACIDSVLSQNYENWELCISDDFSQDALIEKTLNEYSNIDHRIKVIFRNANGHISASSNSALSLSTGSFCAFLDHDDLLHPCALSHIAATIINNPDVTLLYTDEDKINAEGLRFDPHFKPDFNIDLLLSYNYMCHLTVIKREMIDQVGAFRLGYEGSQDHDLILRVIQHCDNTNIIHIPKVLYHWRAIEGSTAFSADQKAYTSNSGLKAVSDYLLEKGDSAKAILGPVPNSYRVLWSLPAPKPLVTILIPTRDSYNILRQCVDSILDVTDYKNFEIFILDNQTTCPKTLAYFEEVGLRDVRVKVLSWNYPFNYSAINNFGAKHANGELIALINNDIEPINSDWLDEMVSQASRADVGCVGAKLYYPNETIQHGGVILGIGGVAGHSQKYFSRNEHGYFSRLKLVQQLSAVTAACLLVRKDIYFEVGGLNEQFLAVAFNDVDFCLKVGQAGYRNIWTPFAELYHHESVSRGADNTYKKRARAKREADFMREQWASVLDNDPFYNPNLTLVHEDFSLR